MNQVSYKQVLVRLYEETEVSEMKINEIMLARLIKKFDKDIDGIYTIQLNKIVKTIEDGMLAFPIDALNIDFIIPGDYSGENQYLVDQNIHTVTLNVGEAIDTGSLYSTSPNLPAGTLLFSNELIYRLWSDISFPTEILSLDYVVADGKIQFDSIYNGLEVTIFYGSYPKNQNGDFLILEDHIDAILASLKHFLFQKQLFSRKMHGKRIYTDDRAFLRDLLSNKNLEIRNAQVKDKARNKNHIDRDHQNVYNVMIEKDAY